MDQIWRSTSTLQSNSGGSQILGVMDSVNSDCLYITVHTVHCSVDIASLSPLPRRAAWLVAEDVGVVIGTV